MSTLSEDLKAPKTTLSEFIDLTLRISNHRQNTVESYYADHRGYRIQHSINGTNKKYIRPVHIELFIWDSKEFEKQSKILVRILNEIKEGKRDFSNEEHTNINSTIYTIQQSIGIGLDLLFTPNSARKHVGNRFEELLRVITTDLGLENTKMVFKVPYEADGKKQTYKSETDIIISPYKEIKSTPSQLNPDELVVSVKTTSKDRMGKMFLDKLLLQEMFNLDKVKVVGVFLNDVQRKEGTKTSFTIVPGQFIVYSQYIEKMDGVYYLDIPDSIRNKTPFNSMIKPFSEFITSDIWTLLGS